MLAAAMSSHQRTTQTTALPLPLPPLQLPLPPPLPQSHPLPAPVSSKFNTLSLGLPPLSRVPSGSVHHSNGSSIGSISRNPPSLSLPPPTYSHVVAPSSSMQSHIVSSPPPATTDRLPPLANHDSDDKMLPSLSSITGDFAMRGDVAFDHHHTYPHQHPHQHPGPTPLTHWPPPFNATSASVVNSYRQPPPFHAPDSPATTADYDGTASVASAPSPSPDRLYDGTPTPSSLTLDDPDVRLAAEALGDLRADFVSSPPDTSSLPPMSPLATSSSIKSKPPRPEPLLSLLTTAHPLVASTIGGASSAYGGAKNFSPRFKSGAEYVEGYLTPIAKTVNSVGRVTGVEGGVRWFLGGSRRHLAPTSDPDVGNSKKRRKTGENGDANSSPDTSAFDDSASISSSKTPRRLSSASTVDTLPAYDDQRSPAYTETAPIVTKPAAVQPWQTRLIMSTSGLSVAMSAESLRSLKYCLRWLRWTNDHMNGVIVNLKSALEEYEKAEKSEASPAENSSEDQIMEADSSANSKDSPNPSRSEVAARINTLKGDVLKTLQDVINNVSKYAGGALPDNARILVRRHLTSLPQRFRLATMSDAPAEAAERDSDSAMREGAQKVLVLAKEGLEMVTQVTGVLDGTIVSAEQWCERMGKRRRGEDESLAQDQPQVEANGDVKMSS